MELDKYQPGISPEASTVRELVKQVKHRCGEIPDSEKAVKCRAAAEEFENELDAVLKGEDSRESGEFIVDGNVEGEFTEIERFTVEQDKSERKRNHKYKDHPLY